MTDTAGTDMSGEASAVDTAAQKRPRLSRLRIALGMLPQPDSRPPYIWLERWDAFIIGAIFMLGVPLLAFSGFSLSTKWIIAAFWFAVSTPFFVYFEGRELLGQMQGRGSIKPEQISEQQNTAQDPFYGIIGALFIWFVVLAVHVTINTYPMHNDPLWRFVIVHIPVETYSGLWTSQVPYSRVEWLILLHGWIVTSRMNYIVYNLGNTLSKATPMGERIERRQPN